MGVKGPSSFVLTYVDVSGRLLSTASTSVKIVLNSIAFKHALPITFLRGRLTSPTIRS